MACDNYKYDPAHGSHKLPKFDRCLNCGQMRGDHEPPPTKTMTVFVLCRGAYEDSTPVGVYAQLTDAQEMISGHDWEEIESGHWVNWMGNEQPRGENVGSIHRFVIRKGL